MLFLRAKAATAFSAS